MTNRPQDSRPVWITGAGGLIGSHIVAAAPSSWHPIALTRQNLDLGNLDAIRARWEADHPAAVIHCAAISKAADCEANPEYARRINVDVTSTLATLAAGMPMIFLSTDLVFDGAKGNYTEIDAPNPLTAYARTKLEAEQAVLPNARHTVIRTSLNGGPSPYGDRSFTEQLITAWKAGRTPKLFADEFRSPLMAAVTARVVWEFLERGIPGIFHVGGAERLSRHDIGQLLAARVPRLKPQIERASFRDYPGPPRAPDTSLISARASGVLSFQLPRFGDWLRDHWPMEP